jgi:hypothetical protein
MEGHMPKVKGLNNDIVRLNGSPIMKKEPLLDKNGEYVLDAAGIIMQRETMAMKVHEVITAGLNNSQTKGEKNLSYEKKYKIDVLAEKIFLGKDDPDGVDLSTEEIVLIKESTAGYSPRVVRQVCDVIDPPVAEKEK